MPGLLDLSQKADPLLGELINRVNAIVGDTPYLLAGATARDLLLHVAHGVDPRRATKDIDLAFLVSTREEYLALREKLLASGEFEAVPRKGLHNFRFRRVLEVDVLPFGAIERHDRTIALPPDGAIVMNMFGFREARAAAVTVKLPSEAHVQVVSLPALAILKLVAWKERRYIEPGKDAHDLKVIIKNYLDAGNHDRIYDENPDAGGSPYDYEAAGAWLLGKDMAKLVDAAGDERLAQLIAEATDEQGQLGLVGDMMREDPDRALELLIALEHGFTEGRPIG